MKILYVIPSLSHGGAEHLVVQQLNWMVRNNYDVSLLILSSGKTLFNELNLVPEKVISLDDKKFEILSAESVIASFRSRRKIQKIIKLLDPDRIVCHLPISHFLLRIVLFFDSSMQKHIQLFSYHHSMQYEANPINSIGLQLYHILNNFLSVRIDTAHIFISKAVKENITSHLRIKKGYLFRNAIEAGVPDIEIASDSLKSYKKRVIWMIPGRLHPSKGQLFFLKTSEEFLKKNPNVLIVLAGGGPSKSELEIEISKKGLNSSYLITGEISNPVLLGYLKLSSVVIIPSINEGFGITAIEAMQFGKTILASDAGGLKEIIRNSQNGFLFEKHNQMDLLEKLEFLMENEDNVFFKEQNLINEFHEKYLLDNKMKDLVNFIEEFKD